MQNLLFTIQLPFFLILSAVCFTIPGFFLLLISKVKFQFWEKLILGTTLGFVFFTLLSYILLVINAHILILPIIFIIDFFTIKKISLGQISFLPKIKLALLSLVFLIGIVGQMAIIAPSGIFQDGDLVFFSAHGHDGPWHLSLMNEIKKGYPFQNPVFAGEKLMNYHFFSDIAPSDFNNYFKIPSLDLYFRLFPLVFSILLGSLSFILGTRLGGFWAGFWASVFTYFAGSFGYIVTFIQSKTIGGESLFWASQIQSSIGNPPQIISSVIILAFLIFFLHFLKDGKGFLICALLAGTLVMFKSYGGVVVLLSLLIVAIWQFIRERKLQFIFLFIISVLVSAIIYFPNTSASLGFLIFEPWWFIRTMVVAPDRLDWLDLELKRQTYIFEENWKRVIQVELTAFLIFFFGNLGMRFLGLLEFGGMLKSFFVNYFNMLFTLIILISFVLPLLFLQKGVASNTIQFLQYFLLLFGILSGITVSKIFSRVKSIPVQVTISLFLIITIIPTQIALMYSFYSRPPFAKIHSDELKALQYLKEFTDKSSVILTPPYNKHLELGDSTPNIWDWYDTAYVSAFSARRTYLADFEQVDIMGYDLETRLKFLENLFFLENPLLFLEKVNETKSDYLYFPKVLKPIVNLNLTNLKRIYTNESVEIWKIEAKETLPE